MLSDRVEAVTICVNYADFLRETLPYNMRHFDRIVVVTSHEDTETRELCRKLGVECRPTDLMTRNGSFDKSRGVDYGIAHLRGDGWVVHIDSDIWLPPQFRTMLGHATLDPQCIYGIDRCNCVGWKSWQSFVHSHPSDDIHHQFLWNCVIKMPPFPMMDRIAYREYGGYVPIGFFQMWNHAKTGRRYPQNHSGAERDDVLHAIQWAPEYRRVWADIVSIHLESEPSELGKNWRGRTSRRFGPDASPQPKQASY